MAAVTRAANAAGGRLVGPTMRMRGCRDRRSAYENARVSHSRRKHEHFAVAHLIFRKDVRTGFRIDRNFRVRKTRLDRPNGLDLVGDGDKKYFPAHCTTCPSAGPKGADLPAFCHGLLLYMGLRF